MAIIFLVIEGAALLIGIRMTRSMTRTVDTLYDATERVKAGDFSYRTHFPPHDQLTALGEAFDSMTASVERLMQESQERMRLAERVGYCARSATPALSAVGAEGAGPRSLRGLQGGALGQRRLLRLLEIG